MANNFHREISTFLKDYGARNVRFVPGGKHMKVVFNFRRREYSNPVPGSPSDHRSLDNQLAQFRNLLGPPIAPHAPKRRKLEDMTSMIRPALNVVEPSIEIQAGLAMVGFVALYSAGKSLRINLPLAAVAAFNAGYSGPPGVVVGFTAPDTWTLRHGSADKPALKHDGSGYLLSAGGFATWEKLGAFAVTPAEVRLVGGTLVVKLTEPPRKQVQRPEPKAAVVEREVNGEPIKAKPKIVSAPTTEILRSALAEIARLEATTSYRLVRLKDTGSWAWRAPTITLEDDR